MRQRSHVHSQKRTYLTTQHVYYNFLYSFVYYVCCNKKNYIKKFTSIFLYLLLLKSFELRKNFLFLFCRKESLTDSDSFADLVDRLIRSRNWPNAIENRWLIKENIFWIEDICAFRSTTAPYKRLSSDLLWLVWFKVSNQSHLIAT